MFENFRYRFAVPFLFIVIIFAVSVLTTLLSLNQTEFANGWDGYYYLIQIKSLLEEGRMHSADNSPVYPLILFIQRIIGDYVLSYKIASSVIHGLFSISIFIYSFIIWERLNGTNRVRTFIVSSFVSAFSVFSPSAFYFISQFPKNMLGFSFLLLFLAAFEYAKSISIKNRFTFQYFLIMLLLIVLFFTAFITHRFAGGAAITVLLFHLAYFIYKKSVKIVIAAIILLSILGLLTFLLPGILHVSDLERFAGFVRLDFSITAIDFIKLHGIHKVKIYWLLELALFYILELFVLVYTGIQILYRKDKEVFTLVSLFLFAFLGVFPFYTFELSSMGYRFFLGSLLFFPVNFLFLFKYSRIKSKFIFSFTVILLLASFFTYRTYDPEYFDPPYLLFQKVGNRALNKLSAKRTEFDLLIAHKALAEIITFETGIDVLPWAPEKTQNKEKIWRIAYGLTDKKYQEYTKDYRVYYLMNKYSLVREDEWEGITVRLQSNNLFGEIENWKNPTAIRPEYLLRSKNE
jgi:hypothetical protein